jgi:hypothetical protein
MYILSPCFFLIGTQKRVGYVSQNHIPFLSLEKPDHLLIAFHLFFLEQCSDVLKARFLLPILQNRTGYLPSLGHNPHSLNKPHMRMDMKYHLWSCMRVRGMRSPRSMHGLVEGFSDDAFYKVPTMFIDCSQDNW